MDIGGCGISQVKAEIGILNPTCLGSLYGQELVLETIIPAIQISVLLDKKTN